MWAAVSQKYESMTANSIVDVGSVKVCDGTRIVYRRQGDASGPKVALVHSLALDAGFWQPVADLLAAQGCDVLTYDCRGHGKSEGREGFTVQLFAEDLRDLLDHVSWKTALVAGASMGGCVSLAFAAAFPDRISALGLIDTTAWYGADAPAQWEERAQRALKGGLADLIPFQKSRWFTEGFSERRPEVLRAAAETFLANDVGAYAALCRMLGACDLREALKTIVVPTKVIVGEEDYATPIAMARALHEGIAESTLKIIEKARHLTPLEVPDIVAEELMSLLLQSVREG